MTVSEIENGRTAMKKRGRAGIKLWLWIAVMAALSVGPFRGQVGAYTQCGSASATICNNPSTTSDCDQDGFTDDEECNGLKLDSTAGGTASITFQGWKNHPGTDVTTFLDPAYRDLFVIANKKATGSRWPDGALKDLLSVYSTNLRAVIHEIPATGTGAIPTASDRKVKTKPSLQAQNALRLTESLDASADFGSGNWGTPNGNDNATIWTKAIDDYIEGLCVAGKTCKASVGGTTTTGITNVKLAYKKWVLSHEVGHMSKLTSGYDASTGGHHYGSSQRKATLMEQSIYVDNAASAVTFYIPTGIGSTDLADSTLNGLN